MDASDVDALLIHAVYLLNCASERPGDPREVARVADRLAARRRGARRASASCCTPARRSRPAGRAGDRSGPARSSRRRSTESEDCPLHLENTAGTGGTLGPLVRGAGGADRARRRRRAARRRAWTPATCSRPATTSAPPTALSRGARRVRPVVGLDRLGSLHLNDSLTPLGSNRDRHANVGEGEIGREGCAAFLSEPRFDGLPVRVRGPRAQRQGRRAPRTSRTRARCVSRARKLVGVSSRRARTARARCATRRRAWPRRPRCARAAGRRGAARRASCRRGRSRRGRACRARGRPWPRARRCRGARCRRSRAAAASWTRAVTSAPPPRARSAAGRSIRRSQLPTGAPVMRTRSGSAAISGSGSSIGRFQAGHAVDQVDRRRGTARARPRRRRRRRPALRRASCDGEYSVAARARAVESRSRPPDRRGRPRGRR